MTRPPAKRDGDLVICPACSAPLARRYVDRDRALVMLDERWSHDRTQRVWYVMPRAEEARSHGHRVKRRPVFGMDGPDGWLPYNLP